ncbi:hypothetical protein METBIDRAFT_164761 [Metschnikowia bicuspidata var. bicuspidata NRRL YB-4993]|uniref:Uncharacterized protein n=1 Tax=Metschnikowia bicuspidata var. bicuspidata NRRL YB-4993 TaxID=869754 RepID=A0A1A0HA16_9ASCO|nr:hypothetical protein METBIDRAFT_164761 [Metschnikowia bicuspidata var. bicuspidata NRRL YB-4993]OBA20845.1 hypothetical protein METBIDRAFT_164761 [Metschnikowia bicuspidata var. bicuspidata NRRL YB-4993]
MVDLSVEDISSIPPVGQVSKFPKDTYVHLPVVVLSYTVLERTAILLVTDFTSHPDLGFAKGNLPSFLLQPYTVGNLEVKKNEVIAVGVFIKRARKVWDMLKEFRPQLLDSRTWDFLRLCVLALIYFRPQAYRNGLEGYLSTIDVWKGKLAGPVQEALDTDAFASLFKRLAHRMTPELYHQLGLQLPIERLITAKEVELDQPMNTLADISTPNATMSSQDNSMHPGNAEEPPKRRRLDPRAAVYQQQFTQVPEPHLEGHSDLRPETLENTSSEEYPEFLPNNRYRGNAAETRSLMGPQGMVEFTKLADLECAYVKDGSCFDTMAKIVEFRPPAELLFVKSFGRTMRITPFTVVIEERDKQVSVYVSSEEDMCRFFDIPEVEVIMNHMLFFHASMNSLLNKKVQIRIERKTKYLVSGASLPYWGVSSSLKTLIQQAWSGA